MRTARVLPHLLLALGLALAAAPAARASAAGADKTAPVQVDFAQLASFNFSRLLEGVGSSGAAKYVIGRELPQLVEKLDNRRVIVAGYMLPLRWKKGRVTEFLVMRDTNSCCYGQPPKINELIRVKIPREGVEAQMDVPLFFQGTLRIAPVITDGVLETVYALDFEKVTK